MYFTFGWPKILKVPHAQIGDDPEGAQVVLANRDKILFAVLTFSSLSIWTTKPCLAVVGYQRSRKSVEKLGTNASILWKPDSTALVVMTSGGYLLFYALQSNPTKNLYEQSDSDNPKLRRESDVLFPKEPIPALTLSLEQEIAVQGHLIGSVSLFRDEIMVSSSDNHILRYRWDGSVNRDFTIDLRRIPFSIDQQVLKAIPIQEAGVYAVDLHYSPLIGGFSLVLSDGRAGFLTATTKAYDPNSVQGIWAINFDDVTTSNVNHKYRLISFGRRNSETAIFSVDEQSGGLNHLFSLKLSSKDFPGSPGQVVSTCWTPDGCAIAVCWDKGGFGLWSVFGSLLTCSLSWTCDFSPFTQRKIKSLDWSAEGYTLWVAFDSIAPDGEKTPSAGEFGVISFMKSGLTVNPAMSQIEHLYLQGEDRLMIYFSIGDPLCSSTIPTSNRTPNKSKGNGSVELSRSSPRGSNKNWVVIPIPHIYLSSNWPIRYTAIDPEGLYIGVSGRYGLAFFSIPERKWKLFGNEAQERDFVVTGGMIWWEGFLVVSVYDISHDRDELRFYPRDQKLNNRNKLSKCLPNQILLLSLDRDKLLVFCADSTLAICQLKPDLNSEAVLANPEGVDPCDIIQTIDLSGICVHPACVISAYLTTLKNSFSSSEVEGNHSLIINISGRLMLLHHEYLIQQENSQASAPQYITPTILASNVELIWLPRIRSSPISAAGVHNPYLSEALWLYCGQEMRVWLPLREKSGSGSQVHTHTFISNRIMLGFSISIYPLTILFERALILGVENDSPSYICNATFPSSSTHAGLNMFPYPFCILQRTSQVYLHQIFRQLIRRNLGYYAWEIARSCSKLPYFHHSLELLLHEVLEEEATSKEPIPDALLPPVIEFVREFPVYFRTVGQCARKTELALWPYLFNFAGRPSALFEECLHLGQLDNASTYLLIIQNLESSTVSRRFASKLLDKALEGKNWDLIKDLVRFLKAIDPNEVDTPRNSGIKLSSMTPPVSPSEYDISMVLGSFQVPRNRSLSTSVVPKFHEISHRELNRTNSDGHRSSIFLPPSGLPPPSSSSTNSPGSRQNSPGLASSKTSPPPPDPPTLTPHNSFESPGSEPPNPVLFTDPLIERHARKILCEGKLRDLGKLAAHLDFHLVSWLQREKRRRGLMVTDFVAGLKMIHSEFNWPWPDFLGSPDGGNNGDTMSSATASHHSRSGSSDSAKIVAHSEGISPLKPLSIEVRHDLFHNNQNKAGDSGYNSTPGGPGNNHEGVFEARLLPYPSNQADDSLSVMSEESSMLEVNSPTNPMGSESYVNMFGGFFHSQNSTQLNLLNSSKAGIELRFLQQIMWEAGIFDWSLLISIALRDALGVVRSINSSRDSTQENLRNLREGIVNLSIWANTQCLGYNKFISAMASQVGGILTKFLTEAENAAPVAIPPPTVGQGPVLTQTVIKPGFHPHSTQAHSGINRRKTEPALMSRGFINTTASRPQTVSTSALPSVSIAKPLPQAMNNLRLTGKSPRPSVSSITESETIEEMAEQNSQSEADGELTEDDSSKENSVIETANSPVEEETGAQNCQIM